MAYPPTDADGVVQPHDDMATFPNESHVLRYVTKEWLKPNENPAGTRFLASGAFSESSKERDRYQGMSVDAYELMVQDGLDASSRMGPQHEGAVLLQVGELRRLGLMVGMEPLDDNPYHAAVWGVQKRHRRKIRNIASWLIRPADINDGLPMHATP